MFRQALSPARFGYHENRSVIPYRKESNLSLTFLKKLLTLIDETLENIFAAKMTYFLPMWPQNIVLLPCSGQDFGFFLLSLFFNGNQD